MNESKKKCDKIKVGRPRNGKELKNVCSIRMENKIKTLIIKNFGSVQKWIDGIINEIKW